MTMNPLAAGVPIKRRLITICIPVYNEELNLGPLLVRLRALAENRADYDFEFLFIDDASEDGTFARLAEEVEHDRRVRVLRLSRNFGFQRVVLTGYLNARGDAAVQIDADLQDPPELISEFITKWEQGYKVVFGIRRRRKENIALHSLRRLAYRIIAYLSDVSLPLDAGDFRLIDRVIIEHLHGYQDRSPYLRGIIATLGYPQIGIPYDRGRRAAGSSKFGIAKLLALAIDGVCSQSTKPLHYITLFGIGMSLAALIGAVVYFGQYLIFSGEAPRGFTTLVLLLLISLGINSACLGILGEYIGRIYNNVRGEPIFIIEHRMEARGREITSMPTESLREPME